MSWTDICALTDIIPGTGVCALLGSHQVAIFRPLADEQVYAIDNVDPFYQSSVLSRGILADLHNEWYVASPLKNSTSASKTVFVWKMRNSLFRLIQSG